jgi:hypothetical protein
MVNGEVSWSGREGTPLQSVRMHCGLALLLSSPGSSMSTDLINTFFQTKGSVSARRAGLRSSALQLQVAIPQLKQQS